MSLAELARGAAPKPPAGVVFARRVGDGAVEVASVGPVAEDAVFELGSVTKAVTGLLLADAVVRGEVALDTPLTDCLPAARPRAPITLGELATHTAGLPRLPFAFMRRRGFTNLTDPYEGSTVDELLADLARVRPRRRRMRYSNFGGALLGQALAARAGAP
jgi:serine-type D-Ala-D-Ala carboxypeptidase/endopeptidase